MEKFELINIIKSPIIRNTLSIIDFKGEVEEILNTYIQTIENQNSNSVDNLLEKIKIIFGGDIPHEIKSNILKVSISSKILCQEIKSNEDYDRLFNSNINIFSLIKELFIIKKDINIEDIFINQLLYTFFKIGEIHLRNTMLSISSDEQKVIHKKQVGKSENIIIKVPNESLDEKAVLLRDKIGIESYKKQLDILRKDGNTQNKVSELEFEATNKIIKYIHEYPYQMSKDNGGYKIENILYKKEMFCLGYCILGYSYLEELGIKTKGINELRHIALLINIGDQEYYFDPFKYDSITELSWKKNIGKYKEFDVKGINHVGTDGNTKDFLLSYILTYKGIDLDEEGKFQESIESYEKAIEIDRYNAFAINNLGISYQNIFNYDNALILYKKAIGLYPNYSIAYSDIGELLQKQGKNVESIIYFKEALITKDLYSSEYYSSSILTNIGFSYYELGKYKDSIYNLKMAINNTPNYSKSYKYLGKIFIELGKFDTGNIYNDIYLKLENSSHKINNDKINKLVEFKEFDKLLKILKLYTCEINNFTNKE